MKFKDIYKSANDEIHADKQLLSDILNGSEKKSGPRFKPAYALSCAAAAIVAVTFFAYSDIMMPLREIPYEQAAYSQQDSDIGSPDSSSDANEKAQDKPTGELSADAPGFTALTNSTETDDNAPVTDAIPEQTEKAAATSEYIADSHETEYKESLSKTVTPDEDTQTDTGIITRGTTAVADMARGRMAVSYVESISAADYFDYLGVSLYNVKLPDGMELNFSEPLLIEKSAATDEVLTDTAVFSTAHDDSSGRYAEITASRLSSNAEAYLSDSRYSKTTVNGRHAVILPEGEGYRAYIVINGADISISVKNLTEAELKALLASLN